MVVDFCCCLLCDGTHLVVFDRKILPVKLFVGNLHEESREQRLANVDVIVRQFERSAQQLQIRASHEIRHLLSLLLYG